jgi:hypothetical protein
MSHGHSHDAGQGPVVLDVGGDVGALVLHVPARLDGAEIEITPVGRSGRWQHSAVHPRSVAGRGLYAAVYPALAQGVYQLWDPDGEVALTVEVRGGEVAEASWPG